MIVNKGQYSRLLSRQLRKHFGSLENVPHDLLPFLDVVESSYAHFEENYSLLQHATEVSSRELTEINSELRKQTAQAQLVLDALKFSIKDLSGGNEDLDSEDVLSVIDVLRAEISRRKIAEQQIALSEHKYRGIIENLSLGMIETDNEGHITKVYDQFVEMIGYEADELLGQSAFELFVPKDEQEKFQEQMSNRKEGVAGAYEAKLVRKDGKEIWVIISAAPIVSAEGEVTGSIGLHFDISERKQMEEALITAREDAEAALVARDQFLANISHEIRTPMNAIMGMAGLLGEASLNIEERKYQEAIVTSAKNLLVIINDVLDVSKLNSGKFVLESVRFDLNKTVNDTVKALEQTATVKDIYIKADIDPAINQWRVGDDVRLAQVITNLAGNAIKFTEDGGVTIKITEPSKERLRVEVIDTGVGIAKDKLGSIFEDFTQEDDTVTRKYGGTGLGLSICRQLVDLFGGEIGVDSEKGKGSNFWFEIPLEIGNEVKKVATATIEQLDGVRVLLVEDNEMNRFLARTILKRWGVVLTEAVNGFEAVDALKNDFFDVVLMDLQMPECDGMSATKLIREELRQMVPIIALTANALAGERQRCLDAGMSGYLSKPFAPEALNQTIRHAISNEDLVEIDQESGLSKLREQMNGDFAPFLEVVNDNLKSHEEKIGQAIEAEDWEKLAELAHSVRPTLNIVGASNLAKALAHVEHAVNHERYEMLELQGKELLNRYKELLERIPKE